MGGDGRERTIAGLRVLIDRSVCIGSGNCASQAPEVFVVDAEGLASFVDDPSAAERERLVAACRQCPVDALAVLDADGRQLAP